MNSNDVPLSTLVAIQTQRHVAVPCQIIANECHHIERERYIYIPLCMKRNDFKGNARGQILQIL